MFRSLVLSIANLIRIGTVVESKANQGKSLARVDIHGRVTDWLPVMGISNSFVKIYIPIQAGEQVTVLCEFGDADSGIIIPSLFSSVSPEPSGADASTMIVSYSDGGEFRYNTQSGKMLMRAVAEAKVVAPHIELVCETGHSTGSWDIDGALHVGEEISTDSTVADARGDLSNFTTTDGASRA